MGNQWEIIDDKGCIHSGREDEMTTIFYEMTNSNSEDCWEGDLKLIEVHNIYR